jgi:hypothetical protein
MPPALRYSSEYQKFDRKGENTAGEARLLVSWVLVRRPHVLKSTHLGGALEAGFNTHCTLACSPPVTLHFFYLPYCA